MTNRDRIALFALFVFAVALPAAGYLVNAPLGTLGLAVAALVVFFVLGTGGE